MSLLELRDAVLKRKDGDTYLSPRGTQGMVVSIVFTALATGFVSARLYTRLRLMRRMESNDWMVVIALVSLTHTDNKHEGY